MAELLTTLTTMDWTAYAGVAVAFILAFEKLAKLTPTESDNKIVAGAYKLFAVLGLKVKDNAGTAADKEATK